MAAALCYGVRGGGTQLAFHITPGNYDADTLIGVLGELRRFLGGEKATLLGDGLPAHRSHAMRAWLATQRSWLVVERLPARVPFWAWQTQQTTVVKQRYPLRNAVLKWTWPLVEGCLREASHLHRRGAGSRPAMPAVPGVGRCQAFRVR